MSSPALLDVTAVGPAMWSGFYNNALTVWPQGDSVLVPAGRDLYVCGGWRVVNNHGAGDVLAEKAGPWGGVRLTVSFTGADQWVYLRQLVPGLMRFSGGVFSPTFDVETSGPVGLDFYGQARYSTSDAERILVADTPTLGPASGRRLVSATFMAPQLSTSSPWPMTDRACAELALRLNSTGAGDAVVTVFGASLPEGTQPRFPALESPMDAQRAVEAFEECGSFRLTGLTSADGQKSTWVPWRTKHLPVSKDQIRLADVTGAPGCISGYNRLGVRTDGIVPTIGASPKYGYQSGCSVILPNDSPLVGLAGTFRVIAY